MGGKGGGGVAADGFQQDALGGLVEAAQLLGHHESVFLVADHEDRREPVRHAHTQGRVLQHGVVTGQRQELLGIVAAAHRPQPASRTAGQNDGGDQAGCQGISPLFAHLLAGFCPND